MMMDIGNTSTKRYESLKMFGIGKVWAGGAGGDREDHQEARRARDQEPGSRNPGEHEQHVRRTRVEITASQ